jgi:hypothetical protein
VAESQKNTRPRVDQQKNQPRRVNDQKNNTPSQEKSRVKRPPVPEEEVEEQAQGDGRQGMNQK